MDVITIAHPVLKRLGYSCQETVHLVQREGTEVVYIDKVEPDVNSVRMVSKVGLRLPMFSTAVGKAMLAYMEPNEVGEIWKKSHVRRFTEHTIIDFDGLLGELEKVRERGYALDNEENELGVRCMAASVFDYRGKPKYAFSISAPVSRMTDEKIEGLVGQVKEIRRNLSAKLGYSGKI